MVNETTQQTGFNFGVEAGLELSTTQDNQGKDVKRLKAFFRVFGNAWNTQSDPTDYGAFGTGQGMF